jgi:hypothetical protein
VPAILTILLLFFAICIASVNLPLSIQAGTQYKVWILAYNVHAGIGNLSACIFTEVGWCEEFDMSKLFLEKGSQSKFIAGFVPITLDAPPQADMQMCFETQDQPVGYLFKCQPITMDSKGFYTATLDFKQMDRSTGSLFENDTNILLENTLLDPTP